jgi:hypothetical protein
MKFILLMNTMSGESSGIGEWEEVDLQRHIAFMRDVNARLQSAGEFVTAEGLAFPDEAKRVVARLDGPADVSTDFPATEKFLAGFWIIDVADERRALEIAAEISAAPGPRNEPLNMPIEVRPIMSAPPV